MVRAVREGSEIATAMVPYGQAGATIARLLHEERPTDEKPGGVVRPHDARMSATSR